MRFVIIHGYTASPDAHWFPWLREELTREGHSVDVVALPSPDAPNHDEWVAAISQGIEHLDSKTCVITHSLGGVATLSSLSSLAGPQAEWNLSGLFMISPFTEHLQAIPELDAFIDAAHVDLGRITPRIGHIEVFYSTNDVRVEPELTLQLAEQLGTTPTPVDNAGHFCLEDGFSEFPALYEHISRWCREQQ